MPKGKPISIRSKLITKAAFKKTFGYVPYPAALPSPITIKDHHRLWSIEVRVEDNGPDELINTLLVVRHKYEADQAETKGLCFSPIFFDTTPEGRVYFWAIECGALTSR